MAERDGRGRKRLELRACQHYAPDTPHTPMHCLSMLQTRVTKGYMPDIETQNYRTLTTRPRQTDTTAHPNATTIVIPRHVVLQACLSISALKLTHCLRLKTCVLVRKLRRDTTLMSQDRNWGLRLRDLK